MNSLTVKLKLVVFSGVVATLLLIVATSGWLATRNVGAQLPSLSTERLPSIANLIRINPIKPETLSDAVRQLGGNWLAVA
ncbi:MAG: hypothetical protein WCH60_07340 [Burkholderiales bacterium]